MEFKPDLKPTQPKVGIIDADSIMYQLGWKFKQIQPFRDIDYSGTDIPREVFPHVTKYMDALQEKLGVNNLSLHFTASSKNSALCAELLGRELVPAFRSSIDLSYKEHRVDTIIPYGYLVTLRALVELYGDNCYFHDLVEADDAVVLLKKFNPSYAIASNDKDVYNQIVGKNYLYDKRKRFTTTSKGYANMFPYFQTLTGDPTDGFTGAKGVGPATAVKALDQAMSPYEMWQAVVKVYESAGMNEEAAVLNMRHANMHQLTLDGLVLFEPPTKDQEHVYP